MSRVVVAWKPRAEKASAAASSSRWAVSVVASWDGAGLFGAGTGRAGLDMVDSMSQPSDTKQALSKSRPRPRRPPAQCSVTRLTVKESPAPPRLRSRPRGLPQLGPRVRRADRQAARRADARGEVGR